MISLVKNALNYFSSGEEEKEIIKQKITDLLAELEEDDDCENNDQIELSDAKKINPSNCFKQNGKITHVDSSYGLIDGNIRFEANAFTKVPHIKIGDEVSYLAYKYSDDLPIKIISIEEIILEVWNSKKEQELLVERILDDLANGLTITKPEPTEYFNIVQKSVMGIIINKKENDISVKIHDSDDCENFSLDIIKSQFVPKIGDYVTLICRVQRDESFLDCAGKIISIDAVSPTNSKQIKGQITFVNSKNDGFIDDKIVFYSDSLELGLRPQLRDKVIIDCIEGDYDEKFNWRCLKVVKDKEFYMSDVKTIENIDQAFELEDALKDKNGVTITDIKFEFKNLNEKMIKKILIKNCCNKQHKILRTFFKGRRYSSQLKLIEPKLETSLFLQSTEEIEYTIEATAKNYGCSTEYFVFQFGGGFQICKQIDVDVECSEIDDNLTKNVFKPKLNTGYTNEVWKKQSEYSVVSGGRTQKSVKFVAVKLGSHDVPMALKNAVLNIPTKSEVQDEINNLVPCFLSPLCSQNYINWFAALLHLEEIANFHSMRQYDMDRAHFVREGEYLALYIENIGERRPSLVLGDSIRLTNPWSTENQYLFEGHIHKVLADRILLKFAPTFHDEYNGQDYKAQFFFSRKCYRKQHFAVREVVKNLEMVLFPVQIKTKKPQLDLKLENNDYFYIDEMSKEKRKIEWFNKSLNPVQKEAIKNILIGEARPMPYIIFGPPGTGKTITLIETILQIFTHVRGSRILVATPSNSSADLIVERLIESEALITGEFVRLVGQNIVERELIPEHLAEHCATVDIALERTTDNNMIITKSGLKLRCQKTIIGKHKITVATCITMGTLMELGFDKGHFSHAIVDEAGQCLETETMIPLTFMNVTSGQVVLAGDPMQLGPIIMSPYSRELGFKTSYLVRLMERFPYQKDIERFANSFDPRLVTKLIHNYRSLPSILNIYNTLFYSSDLIAEVSATDSKESKLLEKLKDILPGDDKKVGCGVFFHGIRGDNKRYGDSPSWCNPQEAGQVFYFVKSLYENGVKPADIGIITPYTQQVRCLRRLFENLEMDKPKIGSVEEFQGQERQIIIISTVRSSTKLFDDDRKFQLGFVRSKKRMNVAVSRARAVLIIFGNPHLLQKDDNWKYVIKYCNRNNTVTGIEMPAEF